MNSIMNSIAEYKIIVFYELCLKYRIFLLYSENHFDPVTFPMGFLPISKEKTFSNPIKENRTLKKDVVNLI